MSNQWHRGGGRGRGGSGNRGGGRGGFGGGTNSNQQPRRDLLRDDFGVEFPLWPLTSYGPGASKNNLLGGDTSVEELRWVSGATRARTGDHMQVFDAFKEYARLKENDRTVLKSMPETQLKQVFDSVDQGTMKPAGLERKIEHQMVPSGGGGKAYERILPTVTSSGVGGGSFGAFGGGASAAFGAVSPLPPNCLAAFNNSSSNNSKHLLEEGKLDLDGRLVLGTYHRRRVHLLLMRVLRRPCRRLSQSSRSRPWRRRIKQPPQISLRPILILPIRSAREISQLDRFQINRLPPSIVPRYSIRSNKVHVEDL